MSGIIVVFASLTGNTEDMAKKIVEGIKEAGIEPVVKNVDDVKAEELANYHGIILGAYTWGDGELPDEFLDFYEEMDDLALEGKKAAVFGSCDSSYSEYGVAVDMLISKLTERGAEVVLDGLKVELTPNKAAKEKCVEFGKEFVSKLLD
ncbi:MAG: flavodoxin [Paenibacillaceae bacterium]|jgi:flavodoxin I|nr:flavodoxin [Paenibacillaceae bacterium]